MIHVTILQGGFGMFCQTEHTPNSSPLFSPYHKCGSLNEIKCCSLLQNINRRKYSQTFASHVDPFPSMCSKDVTRHKPHILVYTLPCTKEYLHWLTKPSCLPSFPLHGQLLEGIVFNPHSDRSHTQPDKCTSCWVAPDSWHQSKTLVAHKLRNEQRPVSISDFSVTPTEF